MSSKFHGSWINSLKKEGNQTITSINTEIHGAGCGLDRVWIGLDPGLDRPRPRIGPAFLCMLHLGCSVTRKGRQGEQAASGQLGSLDVQQLQLDCLTAWQRGLATRQLGCLTAWLLSSAALQQVQLDTLKAWQRGFTTVCCLLGRVNTADINSPIYSIIPKVWIKGLDQLPWKGLDRGSGSEVWIVCGTGAWSRPYILSRSHIWKHPYVKTWQHLKKSKKQDDGPTSRSQKKTAMDPIKSP